MAKGKKMKTIHARPIAKEVEAALKAVPCVADVVVCGSMRRMRPELNDVDVVVVSETMNPKGQIWSQLPKCDHLNNGNTDKRIIYKGLQFDIRVFPHRAKGAALLFSTGSARFNVQMRSHAKRLGFKLNRYGVWKGDTNLTVGFDEKQIFELLGLKYVEPKDRDDSIITNKKIKRRTWVIRSKSNPNKKYKVSLEDGELRCECKGFTFRRTCWHTKKVRESLGDVMPEKERIHKYRKIKVMCSSCNEWHDEREVDGMDIYEDMEGKDVLVFICPRCGTKRESRRYME